jgi:2-polyprenyl-3-methyl-5-hydroxy-6-metoxy-1,4-benzoquinol methylase
MDWTKTSTDPNNIKAMQAVHQHLLNIRVVKEFIYLDWLIDKVREKKCLDIGAIEHDLSYTEKETWKHKRLVESASKVVGVDIIKEYVQVLNDRGYDIRLCDATSDVFIGEKFDIVIIGDVLEHVSNPVNLLQFALRHLNKNGEIIIKTPNPHYKGHIKSFIKNRYYINLEHMAWYSPAQMLEVGRRANCVLKTYLVKSPLKKPWYSRFVNPEFFSQDYVYIFTHG